MTGFKWALHKWPLLKCTGRSNPGFPTNSRSTVLSGKWLCWDSSKRGTWEARVELPVAMWNHAHSRRTGALGQMSPSCVIRRLITHRCTRGSSPFSLLSLLPVSSPHCQDPASTGAYVPLRIQNSQVERGWPWPLWREEVWPAEGFCCCSCCLF